MLPNNNEYKELMRYDGKISGSTHGWELLQSEEGKMVHVPFEGTYESKGGRIQSPVVRLDKSTDEAAYYSLNFKAKTAAHCYWWIDLFDADKNPLPDINSAVYPGAKEEEDYKQMIYVGKSAQFIQVAFQSKGGTSVRDLNVKRVSAASAAKWNDELYSTLPALNFRASYDSFKLLSETVRALRTGTPWKIVMLGDSIMNDTYNSVFQALVKKDFPKSNIDFIISVRGSTGCWFYQEPQNFKDYVAKYKPDLLMIGGISNLREDPDNIPSGMSKIANVIAQAKALGCEIVLMSPPHSIDWRKYDVKNEEAKLPVTEWTEETFGPNQEKCLLWSPYEKLAEKCNVAFWNITKPMADYIARSKMPHNYFNRDYVHNNDRGKQIIGRILNRIFQTALT